MYFDTQEAAENHAANTSCDFHRANHHYEPLVIVRFASQFVVTTMDFAMHLSVNKIITFVDLPK